QGLGVGLRPAVLPAYPLWYFRSDREPSRVSVPVRDFASAGLASRVVEILQDRWRIRYRVPLTRRPPGSPARAACVVNSNPWAVMVSRSAADGIRSWSVNKHKPSGANTRLISSTTGSTLR